MDLKLKPARTSSKKMQLVDRVNNDNNNSGIGKRKMLVGESLPVPKKQNVLGLLSCQSKSRKSWDLSSVYPGDGLRGQDVGKCSNDFEKMLDFNVNVKPDTVTSLRIVDKVPLDFRCTICKDLPRLLNRSELYRHYSFRHFYSNLMTEFGHLKTCPVCKVDLKTNAIVSHFGQKHSHVEHFLPVEAWIPLSKVGANISRGRIGRCDKDYKEQSNRKGRTNKKLKKVGKKNSPTEVPLVWPETPQEFKPDGHERGVKSSFLVSKQTFRIATVDGFDIELNIDDEPENLVLSSEMRSPASAHEQVMQQCRICKKGFDTKQLVVLHVQTTHDMKGSGDEIHDYDALLRSGHIVPEQNTNTADVPALTTEGTDALSDETFELTDEEAELFMAVENDQQNEVFYLADGSTKMDEDDKTVAAETDENDKTVGDWDNVCDAFNAKLWACGAQMNPIDEAVDKSDKEWEVTCAAFESMFANICDTSDVLGMNAAKEWGEVFAVENRKDLQHRADSS